MDRFPHNEKGFSVPTPLGGVGYVYLSKKSFSKILEK